MIKDDLKGKEVKNSKSAIMPREEIKKQDQLDEIEEIESDIKSEVKRKDSFEEEMLKEEEKNMDRAYKTVRENKFPKFGGNPIF